MINNKDDIIQKLYNYAQCVDYCLKNLKETSFDSDVELSILLVRLTTLAELLAAEDPNLVLEDLFEQCSRRFGYIEA